MSETTLTSPSTITPLQSMLHELYALLESIKIAAPNGSYSGYTGAAPKVDMTMFNALSTGAGYITGSGGTVTQITSKTTTVTLNKPTGKITMHNASMANGAIVAFALSNTCIGVSDCVVAHRGNNFGGNAAYRIWIDRTLANAAVICVENISGGSLAEAVEIVFAVVKGATS